MTLKVIDHPKKEEAENLNKTVFELDGCTVTFEAEEDIRIKDFFWFLEQVRMAIWKDLQK